MYGNTMNTHMARYRHKRAHLQEQYNSTHSHVVASHSAWRRGRHVSRQPRRIVSRGAGSQDYSKEYLAAYTNVRVCTSTGECLIKKTDATKHDT